MLTKREKVTMKRFYYQKKEASEQSRGLLSIRKAS
jgi:hypothetical protein